MYSQEQEPQSAAIPALKELSVTVAHDNNGHAEGLRTAWGFAAHLAGPERNILFDTGSDGALLLENLAQLQIEPGRIDTLVLSHGHGDHAGGLTGLLKANPHVRIYLPATLPARFKDVARGYGAEVLEVSGPQEICAGVYTTGVLGRLVKEQALVVRTERGLVVLTGCAHPGIARMVEAVRRLHEEDILLVMGGFHLEWATARKVRRVITVFRSHQIRCVAPTHCSGEKARLLFRKHFGPRCLDIGVGTRLALADIP